MNNVSAHPQPTPLIPFDTAPCTLTSISEAPCTPTPIEIAHLLEVSAQRQSVAA